ncbi:hypothetical protein MMC06_006848 [Schaereria dolodes]|nr:hypothetical protein [Schaereria dolodes]
MLSFCVATLVLCYYLATGAHADSGPGDITVSYPPANAKFSTGDTVEIAWSYRNGGAYDFTTQLMEGSLISNGGFFGEFAAAGKRPRNWLHSMIEETPLPLKDTAIDNLPFSDTITSGASTTTGVVNLTIPYNMFTALPYNTTNSTVFTAEVIWGSFNMSSDVGVSAGHTDFFSIVPNTTACQTTWLSSKKNFTTGLCSPAQAHSINGAAGTQAQTVVSLLGFVVAISFAVAW